MPRGPRTPLKQGRNGTRSINTQLQALSDRIADEEAVQGVAVPDSVEVGSPTTAEFNALLASLRDAGLIAAE